MSSLPTSDDGTAPILFQYHPNAVASCIFIAAFGLGTISHFIKMCWLRTWFFVPFLIGCIMETFGYYGRFWLYQDPQNFKAYVLYVLLVLRAPIFLAATLYMAIRRLIGWLEAEELSPISPKWLSRLFLLGDLVCFLVQISGIGMQTTTDAHIQRLGGTVVVVGLVLQILVFILFIAVVWNFLPRCRLQVGANSLHRKRYIVALLGASGLIVLRNIVVGIEHAQGPEGYVARHEAFTYIFDALPIWLVVAILFAYQPGSFQRSVRKFGADAKDQFTGGSKSTLPYGTRRTYSGQN